MRFCIALFVWILSVTANGQDVYRVDLTAGATYTRLSAEESGPGVGGYFSAMLTGQQNDYVSFSMDATLASQQMDQISRYTLAYGCAFRITFRMVDLFHGVKFNLKLHTDSEHDESIGEPYLVSGASFKFTPRFAVDYYYNMEIGAWDGFMQQFGVRYKITK